MKRGECHYDFVEVMACPGGCINGGGQPIRPSFQNKPKDCADRDHCLRAYDVNSAIRFSHENKAVQTLYDEYLEAPLSDRASSAACGGILIYPNGHTTKPPELPLSGVLCHSSTDDQSEVS